MVSIASSIYVLLYWFAICASIFIYLHKNSFWIVSGSSCSLSASNSWSNQVMLPCHEHLLMHMLCEHAKRWIGSTGSTPGISYTLLQLLDGHVWLLLSFAWWFWLLVLLLLAPGWSCLSYHISGWFGFGWFGETGWFLGFVVFLSKNSYELLLFNLCCLLMLIWSTWMAAPAVSAYL